MNHKTTLFNLIVLAGVLAGILFNTNSVQAKSSTREQQLSMMLASAVEFRWDSDVNAYRSHESLGTKISANIVLTHNHFSNLAGTHIVDPSNTKRPHPISKTTQTASIGSSTQYGAQTRLLYSDVKYAGSLAPVASQRTISRLRVGDTVDVVYWDDIHQKLAVAKFQIKEIRNNSIIVLDDPSDIINSGDSGGGVFYHGNLVGNTWKFIQIQDLNGNQIEKVVYVQIIPSELNQTLRNW
jgi:hypothetical protein